MKKIIYLLTILITIIISLLLFSILLKEGNNIILSFIVPDVFVSIAFDSGGVASGPMTATFLLPFAVGACTAVGKNVATDAFGVVAMVAMTPLIAIQILGLVYKIKQMKAKKNDITESVVEPIEVIELSTNGDTNANNESNELDDDIIEF